MGVRPKELAFREKMAELKPAGLEIVVSTDDDGNTVIDIAKLADLLPGSVVVCGLEGNRRVSVPDDLGMIGNRRVSVPDDLGMIGNLKPGELGKPVVSVSWIARSQGLGSLTPTSVICPFESLPNAVSKDL